MLPGDGAKPMSRTNALVRKVTPRGRSHATIGSMIASYWSKGVRRACDMADRSGSKGEGQAPHLHRTVLRQRPHDRRPEQPEFGGEEVGPEEFVDAPPVEHCLGR